MRFRRRYLPATPHPDDASTDALEVLRDAEESLVAALQESDTAVEAIQDSGTDASPEESRRRWSIGIAGLLLAALAIVVARRRS